MPTSLRGIQREGDPAFSGSSTRWEGLHSQKPDHGELLRNTLKDVLHWNGVKTKRAISRELDSLKTDPTAKLAVRQAGKVFCGDDSGCVPDIGPKTG